MRRATRIAVAAALALLLPPTAPAQAVGADPDPAAPFGYPVGDKATYAHLLLDEFEGRLGAGASFRWEGEGWIGGDLDRLWVKSEGELTEGQVSDGQQELFYDRPITTYFDLQIGGRCDLDSRPGRGWGAVGIEGFAPWFVTMSATAYASDGGHYGAKLQGSDEIRFTQRLILEPRIELNLYSRGDLARRVGAGLSDLDAGLRLRYEISRKFAPYVGVAFEDAFAGTARLLQAAGEKPGDVRVTVGVRSWF